jgi:hypothetical protein
MSKPKYTAEQVRAEFPDFVAFASEARKTFGADTWIVWLCKPGLEIGTRPPGTPLPDFSKSTEGEKANEKTHKSTLLDEAPTASGGYRGKPVARGKSRRV